jgi:hypothetical protein
MAWQWGALQTHGKTWALQCPLVGRCQLGTGALVPSPRHGMMDAVAHLVICYFLASGPRPLGHQRLALFAHCHGRLHSSRLVIGARR